MAKQFIVETSARHIHVSEADLKVLFGENAKLTPKKDLSQPGQYACEERVTVVGPKKEIKGVSILGPTRKETQVELSATDARSIGLPIVIRESGQLEATPGCKLVGPCGEIEIETIDDKKLAVKVPAGTQVGEKLRVRGHGMPNPRRSGVFGDLYVDIAIKIPTKLSDKQKKLLSEFADLKSDKKGWF
jgi:putative phosphotransacetylase